MSNKPMPTVGADPELFARDRRNGNFVPVCGLLGHDKENPGLMFPGYSNRSRAAKYKFLEDNVMMEFNIPPCVRQEQFVTTVNRAVDECNRRVEDHGLVLVAEPVVGFDPEVLAPHPSAYVFGCDPEFDAYMDNGETEAPAMDPTRWPFMDQGRAYRAAGGHLHLGYYRDDIPPFVAARFADLYIGLALLGPLKESQGIRRQCYGRPGRFRAKPYGIEYRTPSNVWLKNRATMGFISGQAFRLVRMLNSMPIDYLKKRYAGVDWGELAQVIRQEDYERANELQRMNEMEEI